MQKARKKSGKREKKPPVMEFSRTLFWDVDPATIDPKKHDQYIIDRVLDFGEMDEVRWLSRFYDTSSIRKVLLTSRDISPKSANLWALVFGVDKKKMKCLNEQYLKERRKVWPY